jgi:hypothetical protein
MILFKLNDPVTVTPLAIVRLLKETLSVVLIG